MKKIFSLFLISLLLVMNIVLATPLAKINLIDNQQTPIYTEKKFTPLIFLNKNGGRVLLDDPYGPFRNGNITERINNYAFTGEQIRFEVLVWDKNGIDKIADVFAGWATQLNGPIDPEMQVNCYREDKLQDGDSLTENGYPDVRRPGDQIDEEYFDSDTMAIYTCTLTIEPNCYGQKWIGIEVVDIDGLYSTISEAESWFCNPEMEIEVSGEINFGSLGPGEKGSSTISIKNNADPSSGLEVIFGISGTDFYDPSSSGAICPTSNVLKLQPNFKYSAVQGSNQVTDKLIPYGTEITQADPIFSAGDGSTPTYYPLIPTSPGSEISLTFTLELPQPCNGQFTSGDIILWAVAV